MHSALWSLLLAGMLLYVLEVSSRLAFLQQVEQQQLPPPRPPPAAQAAKQQVIESGSRAAHGARTRVGKGTVPGDAAACVSAAAAASQAGGGGEGGGEEEEGGNVEPIGIAGSKEWLQAMGQLWAALMLSLLCGLGAVWADFRWAGVQHV